VAYAALLSMPELEGTAHLLAGIGFQGAGWLLPLVIPALVVALSWMASMATAFHVLRGVT
jgi:cell division transport system permease protein